MLVRSDIQEALGVDVVGHGPDDRIGAARDPIEHFPIALGRRSLDLSFAFVPGGLERAAVPMQQEEVEERRERRYRKFRAIGRFEIAGA